MSRAKARNIAMLVAYSQIFNIPYNEDAIFAPYELIYKKKLEEELMQSPKFLEEKKYIDSIVLGIKNHLEEIDSYISKYLTSWTIQKIAKVDLAILRLSTYEILYCPDVPNNVSISEAVNMAKTYSTEKNAKFINGVLSSINRENILQEKNK